MSELTRALLNWFLALHRRSLVREMDIAESRFERAMADVEDQNLVIEAEKARLTDLRAHADVVDIDTTSTVNRCARELMQMPRRP